MSKERRREPRYPYRNPIEIKVGGRLQETISEDVSYRGLFVVTDDPPPLRTLISLKARVVGNHKPLEAHAMSVYVLEKGNSKSRLPGVGLQFYAMGNETKKHWNAFVDVVRKKLRVVNGEGYVGGVSTPPRQHVRYPVRLEVKPRSFGELEVLYSRDISRGGMFLLSPRKVACGTRMEIDVVHPDSGETFTLNCTIRRVEAGPPFGLGIEFNQFDDVKREAFFEFVHSSVEELDVADLMLIEEGDPSLA